MAFVYDAAGRPVQRRLLASGAVTHTDVVTHDASGRIASITSADGVVAIYSYDGRLVTGEAITGPVPGTIAQTFDAFMRVTSRAVNGSSIAFAYDADGRMSAAGALSIARSTQHGLATSATLGGVTTTFGYNAIGESTQVASSFNAAPLFGQTFTRDALGRITQKVETIGGVVDTYVYSYDSAGRLDGVTRNGAAVESYQYDGNGNRIAATVGGVAATAGRAARARAPPGRGRARSRR